MNLPPQYSFTYWSRSKGERVTLHFHSSALMFDHVRTIPLSEMGSNLADSARAAEEHRRRAIERASNYDPRIGSHHRSLEPHDPRIGGEHAPLEVSDPRIGHEYGDELEPHDPRIGGNHRALEPSDPRIGGGKSLTTPHDPRIGKEHRKLEPSDPRIGRWEEIDKADTDPRIGKEREMPEKKSERIAEERRQKAVEKYGPIVEERRTEAVEKSETILEERRQDDGPFAHIHDKGIAERRAARLAELKRLEEERLAKLRERQGKSTD